MSEDETTNVVVEPQKTPEEIAAFEASPAGKLCKEHPTWKPDECEAIVNKKVWVGMHYDMIVYMWGKPDVSNPSNYGAQTKYQYCWTGATPSCFYDNNQDKIIDAYN